MPDPMLSTEDPGNGVLGRLVAALIVVVAAWFFVPLSVPIKPKDLNYCDRHGGFAEVHASIIDLFQSEGMVACKDGTVRWVQWDA